VSRDDEALAVVIGSAGRLGHVYIDGNDGCLAAARAVLASEWLADHDAAVRAAERDRVLVEVRLAGWHVHPDGYAHDDSGSYCLQIGAREITAWSDADLASASGTPEEGK
jgi:hypothetical protein